MTCEEIAALAPAYLSEELEPEQRAEFDRHLASCPGCAHDLESAAVADARLRDAMDQPLPDASAIERAVRRKIAAGTRLRWAQAAAAAVALAVSGYALFAPNRVLRDAALDHRDEVSLHQPRRWRTDAAEIVKLTARYSLPDAAELAPAGFHLEKAKICGLAGKAALHLVFSDGAREVSVFVRADSASRRLSQSSSAGQQLAAFANGRLQIVVAGESEEECAQFARAAQRVL